MGLESFHKNIQHTNEVIGATADSGDALSPAITAVENGIKAAFAFVGITGSIQKLAKATVEGGYIKSSTLEWLSKMPKVAMLRVFLSIVSTFGAGDVTAKNFASGLNTVYSISQAAEKSRNQMMMRHQIAEAPQVKMQHFIDEVRGPATELREQFGTTNDPVKLQAYRFVIANIFISYKNRIEREGLQNVPGYQESIEKIAGVPIDVVDLYDNNADYRKNYALFKKTLFDIYASDACKQVQKVVQDDKLLEYYEQIELASSDRSGFEEYRREHAAEIQEAIDYFKKDRNLEKAIAYVHPEITDFPDDALGKKVPLDIPDKLLS